MNISKVNFLIIISQIILNIVFVVVFKLYRVNDDYGGILVPFNRYWFDFLPVHTCILLLVLSTLWLKRKKFLKIHLAISLIPFIQIFTEINLGILLIFMTSFSSIIAIRMKLLR